MAVLASKRVTKNDTSKMFLDANRMLICIVLLCDREECREGLFMGAFQKFVEMATDTKYVPVGRKCDICGNKLGFFYTGFWSVNAKQLRDCVLCNDCDKKLDLLLKHHNRWIKKAVRKEMPFSLYTPAKKLLIDLNGVKQCFEFAKAFGTEYLSSFGEEYGSIFYAQEAFHLDTPPLMVGIKRSKLLNNKMVVFGYVQMGCFKQGDKVLIDLGKRVVEASVLEAYVYDCKENTLTVNLRANMGKQRLDQWQIGWLALNTEEDLPDTVTVVGLATSG